MLGLRESFAGCSDCTFQEHIGDLKALPAAQKEGHADLIIADLAGRTNEAIDVFRNFCGGREARPVVVLVLAEESKLVPALLRAGIRGYLLNACSPEQLKRAVAFVREGEIYFSPLAAEAAENAVVNGNGKKPRSEVDVLTDTERKVARLVASEFRDKEIAARLSISLRTVQAHRATLMRKLRVRSAAGVTKFAIRTGLSSLD